MHPTGRLVHKVPCEFEFETRANTYRKFGYTGSLAPDTSAERAGHPTHAIDATGKKTTTTLRMAHGLHRLCPDL